MPKMRIFTGAAETAKLEKCLPEIKRTVADGISCFFIVPEQQTVQTEGMFVSLLPPSAPLSFEVTNFTRLCNTVFRTLGGLTGRYATKDTKALLMWETLRELAPVLLCETKNDLSTVKEKMSLVSELHFSDISPEDLERAAENVDSTLLSDKMHDAAVISRYYRDTLHDMYADNEDDLDDLARMTEDGTYFGGRSVYISGFSSFTAQQMKVIRNIMRSCDLTVMLNIPLSHGELSGSICFDEIRATCKDLLKMSKDEGVCTEIECFDTDSGEISPVISYVSRRLFETSFPLPCEEKNKGTRPIRVISAADAYEGAEFIAADIRRRVSEEKGLKYGDIAIICGDASAYGGILDTALSKSDIPSFLSVRTETSMYEPIRLITCAYSTVCGHYKRSDLISFVKCALCGIDTRACDELELYSETWNIDGDGFFEEWKMNPCGFSTTMTDYDRAMLGRVETTRHSVLSLLSPLQKICEGVHTMREHAEVLYEFLCSMDAERMINERAQKLLKEGEKTAASDYSRLWKMICDSLDRMAETVGKETADAKTFCDILFMVFSFVDIGRIPPSIDDVTIGSASSVRAGIKKHIYLFGVNEGEMPAAVSASSGFDDTQRKEMKAVGIDMPDSTQLALTRELYGIYRALRCCGQTLSLLYFDYDSKRAELHPSSFTERLVRLASDHAELVTVSKLPKSDLIYHANSAADMCGVLSGTAVGESLSEALTDYRIPAKKAKSSAMPLQNKTVSFGAETARGVYGNSMTLSQSRIDSYVRCPFSYFQQYILRVRENKAASFEPSDVGSFIHAILEEYFKTARKEGKTVTEKTEIPHIVNRAAENYIRSISPHFVHHGQTRHLFKRMCDFAVIFLEEICEEFKQSSFTPLFFELKLNKDADKGPASPEFKLPDGATVRLNGVIDRVDAYRDGDDIYVRVIDYKTGKKVFSEEAVAKGENLQLLIYLSALLQSSGDFRRSLGVDENGHLYPAGILYVGCWQESASAELPPADRSESGKYIMDKLIRSGVFLCDEKILSAMNDRGNNALLPIKRKKENLKTMEQWQELFDRMREAVISVAQQIRTGCLDATPLKKSRTGVCEYCAYKPACRNASTK